MPRACPGQHSPCSCDLCKALAALLAGSHSFDGYTVLPCIGKVTASCADLPPDLLASILAFIPSLKDKIRLATVAKGWRAALASPGSYSRGCSPRQWGGGHPFGTVDFEGPEAPVLQQDVLAALAASGIQFWISQGFT